MIGFLFLCSQRTVGLIYPGNNVETSFYVLQLLVPWCCCLRMFRKLPQLVPTHAVAVVFLQLPYRYSSSFSMHYGVFVFGGEVKFQLEVFGLGSLRE